MASLKNLTKLLLFLTYGTTLGWETPYCYCQNANNLGYVNLEETTNDTTSGVIHRTVGSCYLMDTPRNKTTNCWDAANLACYLDTRTENRPRQIKHFICNEWLKNDRCVAGGTEDPDYMHIQNTRLLDCYDRCAQIGGGMNPVKGNAWQSPQTEWCLLATSLTPGH
jgi:hypothetical protein